MARRKKKSKAWGRLLILGGVGLAGYVAYRAGVWDWLTGGTGQSTPPGNGGNGGANGGGNGNGTTTPSWLTSLLALLGGDSGNGNGGSDQYGNTKPPSAVSEAMGDLGTTLAPGVVAGLTFPAWLGGVPEGGATLPASRIPEAILKVLTPLVIGLSPAIPELVHDVNVQLPGEGTGLEKGNMTFLTADGPFVLSPSTMTCYDLGGRRITCPSADQILGVEQHTIEWYRALEEAA